MKDPVCDSATQVRIPETISVAAAVLLPIVQGSYSFTLLILSFVLIALTQQARSENAPEFRGNTEHSGVYEAVGVPKFSQVKWTFHANGQIISSPAVDGGTIYVGSTGGLLYAVDRAAGTERWKFETKSRIASSPAVAGGLVFFGAYDGGFYAVETATGKLKWKFETAGEKRFSARHLHGMQPADQIMADPWDFWESSPVVWNGAIYFGSGDGNIYALDATTGALKWKFKTGDVVHASPAIADGMLFVGSWDSYFYALDAATGAEKWRFKTGEDTVVHNQVGIQSSAAVVDGTVYFGSRDSRMYALDEATGKAKWVYFTGGTWILNSPAVKGDKVFFAVSYGGKLFAAETKTGDIVYSVDFKGWPVYSSPAIAGNMLYVGSTGGTLSAVDLNTHQMAWTFATDAAKQNGAAFTKKDGTSGYFEAFRGQQYMDTVADYAKLDAIGPILSSPVVVDNVIYIASVDGNLYALM